MKIALAQQNYHIGNFEANLQKIVHDVELAKTAGADLVVFSELAVCGYPPRDFLEFDDFIQKCKASIDAIAQCAQGIGVLVGAPTKNPNIEGKDLFNSAYFLYDGKVQQVIHKTLLPTYDVFDEYRYFEPNTQFQCIEFKGQKIAVTVCEDIWNVGNENPMYTVCPMDILIKENPVCMINLSASPFSQTQAESRIHTVCENCKRYKIPMVYVNTVGAQTELIFDGGSLVCDGAGNITHELSYFEEDFRIVSLEDILKQSQHDKSEIKNQESQIARIHAALVLGIRDYFQKLGFKKAVLGLSGGIDSAVTCVLAAEALGAENVFGILLPSKFSSDHSISDAEKLAQNLGCASEIIPIKEGYETLYSALKPIFKDLPFSLAEENMQARIRGLLLMAVSNKLGHILLNTSNKSEAAVGYGTLYGDMCGGISVLGDVYKTQVYELANYINRNEEIIPQNSIVKPPSAELRPNQKDQDSLPEYDILDKILFQYIEKRQGPNELVAMGFEKPLVDRILRMVNINEFKRAQTPPILRVSTKAFGMGRRMPIVGKYLG